MTELKDLEKTCHEIGQRMSALIDAQYGSKQVGFALMLFDFGEGKNLTYISNAHRLDMIKVLYECAATLKAGADQPPLTHGKPQQKG